MLYYEKGLSVWWSISKGWLHFIKTPKGEIGRFTQPQVAGASFCFKSLFQIVLPIIIGVWAKHLISQHLDDQFRYCKQPIAVSETQTYRGRSVANRNKQATAATVLVECVWSGPVGSAGALLPVLSLSRWPRWVLSQMFRRLKCCRGRARKETRVPTIFNCLKVHISLQALFVNHFNIF